MLMRRFTLLLISFLFAVNSFAQEKLIVVNEGTWQADNGRLSYFENGAIVSNKWFQDKNGYKIGDTPNDIIKVNKDLIAIAVNWSNIVQFIKPDGTAVNATEDVPNCRKLATDGNYVYVTSYAHECGTWTCNKGYVAKIDVKTFKVVACCEVGYEPEGIAYYDGHLFVANTGGYSYSESHDYEKTVSIVNASTMKLEKNIDTGCVNLYGKMSQQGKYLLINSAGDYNSVSGKSIVFDCEKALNGTSPCFAVMANTVTYNCPTTDGKFFAISSDYSYTEGGYVINYFTIDPAEAMESAGTGGVTESLPGSVGGKVEEMVSPYGIYVNPYSGYIYVSDAKSYNGAGEVYQFKPDGTFVTTFKVYINPGHFLAINPNASGITNIGNDDDNRDDSVYDLHGRKQTMLRKGDVYIKNGAKFILK